MKIKRHESLLAAEPLKRRCLSLTLEILFDYNSCMNLANHGLLAHHAARLIINGFHNLSISAWFGKWDKYLLADHPSGFGGQAISNLGVNQYISQPQFTNKHFWVLLDIPVNCECDKTENFRSFITAMNPISLHLT